MLNRELWCCKQAVLLCNVRFGLACSRTGSVANTQGLASVGWDCGRTPTGQGLGFVGEGRSCCTCFA